ncbi:hypothetical protein [Paraliomyxa miuraensis]|uniref:hypothetical protein n=1 Tax=Paraliomyxa miuraensis TaxID=376150 RepID=UPI002259B299|nr:hypothetical protein [Paraliomyxa miuraensis]MCX4242481.1 hypothetical protein [Paraliomyxa miuraensis]
MSHPLRPLVRTPVCVIEHCTACDVLHLTLGPVTLRLEITAARRLASALQEALARLDAPAQHPAGRPSDAPMPN